MPGAGGDPFWQLRLFRCLTADQHRAVSQGGKPGGIFLRFRELITAHNQQQILMQQADQHGKLFVDSGVWAVFRQLQGERLARRKKTHRLAQGEDRLPVGAVIQRKTVVFIEALSGRHLAHRILALLK